MANNRPAEEDEHPKYKPVRYWSNRNYLAIPYPADFRLPWRVNVQATIHAIFQTAYKDKPQPSSQTFPASTYSNFEMSWDSPSDAVSTPALTLATELVRLFTMEAIHRSADTAHKDTNNTKEIGDNVKMDVNHLHKNAAALTLDFGGWVSVSLSYRFCYVSVSYNLHTGLLHSTSSEIHVKHSFCYVKA